MHQMSNVIVSHIGPVHIKDMFPILERSVQFFDDPVNMIAWQATSQDIMFRDKDDVAFWQGLIGPAFLQAIQVQETTVEPGPFDAGAFIGSLDFESRNGVLAPFRPFF